MKRRTWLKMFLGAMAGAMVPQVLEPLVELSQPPLPPYYNHWLVRAKMNHSLAIIDSDRIIQLYLED